MELKTIKNKAQKEIEKAGDLKSLDQVFKNYLGKKGKLTLVLKSLAGLSKQKRAKTGQKANEIKKFLMAKFDQKAQHLKRLAEEAQGRERAIDVTRPGKKPQFGHLHPLTQVQKRAEGIFQNMGFSVVEGPEIEDEWHNFDALNIPKDHPARDALSLGKTFYLKEGGLMRTHTSSVQIRYFEKNNPPFRIIVPGRIFRNEATDAKHEFNFYQLEGLFVDKAVSVANLKAVIQEFLHRFFEKSIEIRIRPSYFPFTEPSFEIDMRWGENWMEIMGAGMVHPNVFINAGLNPGDWQGFAFGVGLDRLAMLKYKINDIRLFYSGDLRFLAQF
ncbi:MAG: phenylalanine--tRNA ligase subunit alpha [Candidatus Nealsonbacteria bacterium]|nr:phenylalanine--tRNA ligase subunit alpha [Candidatus Nealsonbacteria bacterium]